MNITLYVEQHLTYREALKIAYDKAKREGTLDEITEASCQVEFNRPPPAAIYHESDMISRYGETENGGFYFKAWNLREVYEQARINGRVSYAESLNGRISEAVDEIKDTLKASGMEFSEQDLKFSINEKGEFKPVPLPGKSSEVTESLFTKLLNEKESLRYMALEYARMVASVIDVTLEGRSAPYALYFSPEQTD
ncbi:hypothetical protein [Pseudomonas sp. NPDC089734]|uniref:hypothetical protein n=1 Tax=Pseudomonas sp. NPDC089734 TaxID=3364469 RepID=UPI00382601A4